MEFLVIIGICCLVILYIIYRRPINIVAKGFEEQYEKLNSASEKWPEKAESFVKEYRLKKLKTVTDDIIKLEHECKQLNGNAGNQEISYKEKVESLDSKIKVLKKMQKTLQEKL